MTPYNYATVEIGLQARGRSPDDDFHPTSGPALLMAIVLIVVIFAVLIFANNQQSGESDPEEEARYRKRKALRDRLDAEYAAREAKKEREKKQPPTTRGR